MGELETREIVNMDEALAIAKESCICWGENVDDELEWAYSDIETYGFSVFGKVIYHFPFKEMTVYFSILIIVQMIFALYNY